MNATITNPLQSTAIDTGKLTLQETVKRQEAVEVANQFEQIFIAQMIQGMRKTQLHPEGDGLFGTGPGSDTYAQWFDQHMSVHISKHGRLGIANTIINQLEQLGQIEKLPEATNVLA